MGDALSPSPGTLVLGAGAGLALLAAALVSTLLAVLAGAGGCGRPAIQAAPPAADTIPARYLQLYQLAGRAFDVPWTVLAGTGAIESEHGRSTAPGVPTGLNKHGCCAGPMQFNVSDGPPSTWSRYGAPPGSRRPQRPGPSSTAPWLVSRVPVSSKFDGC